MRVGDLAAGRAGDKGDTLDLTIVTVDDEGYARLASELTEVRVREAFAGLLDAPVKRYLLPGLRALKYVLPGAMPGGVYSTMHPGLHWQKSAVYVLLDLELSADDPDTVDRSRLTAKGERT